MKPARTFYDPDDTDSRPTFTKKGLRRSRAAVRADRVVAAAFKIVHFPMSDWAHARLRGYIARLRLPPHRLARLVEVLANHDVTAPRPRPDDSDQCEKYGCSYGVYRIVLFYACRAAMSLLVETAPRSRLDLDDLLPILLGWRGVLPPAQQAHVASIIGEHVADIIVGRPFKRRALVPRGGVSLPRRVNRRRSIAENAPRPSLAAGG